MKKVNPNQTKEILSQVTMWKSIIKGEMDAENVVISYLTDKLKLEYLELSEEVLDDVLINAAVNKLVEYLSSTSVERISELLSTCGQLPEVTVKNIPQYSNFASATMYVPEVLVQKAESLSYTELGYILYGESVSDSAANKYGENHGKFAKALDLAIMKKEQGHTVFEASLMGKQFCKMSTSEKVELIIRLCIRIPIIQHALVAENPKFEIEEQMKRAMAYSTYMRRKTNILDILAYVMGE